jgi:hypothetical protein
MIFTFLDATLTAINIGMHGLMVVISSPNPKKEQILMEDFFIF